MLAFEGHDSAVQVLAFTPEGDILLSGGRDGMLRIWSPPHPTSDTIQQNGAILALAVSSDGSMIAAGGEDKIVRIWDLSQRKLLSEIFPQKLSITGLSFTPNDQTLAIALGNRLEPSYTPKPLFFWDVPSQQIKPFLGIGNNGIRSLSGHAKNRYVAWVTDNRLIHVRNLTKSDLLFEKALKAECRQIVFSPDGNLLAAAIDWKIHVYDLIHKQERYILSGHKGIVSSISFSADGRTLLSGSWDTTVKLWEVSTGHETASYSWPIGRVTAVSYAPDGLRAVAGGDLGTIWLWDVEE
jgi:WD40 repeat protein